MNRTDKNEENSLISLADTATSQPHAGGDQELNNIEKLKKHNRSLTNEVMALKRENAALRNSIPLVQDQTCSADAFVKLAKDLEDAKKQRELWENDASKHFKQYTILQQNSSEEIASLEKIVKATQHKNIKLEEEVTKLRSQLENDKSFICKLKKDHETGQSFFTSANNDHQQRTSLPLQNIINEQFEKQLSEKNKEIAELEESLKNAVTAVNAFLFTKKNNFDSIQRDDGLVQAINESYVDSADLSDADRIAMNFQLILETFDKNNRETDDLQNILFKGLADKGFGMINSEKVAAFGKAIKHIWDKRRDQINANNESLAKEYQKNMAIDACFQQLDNESLVNNTIGLDMTNMDFGQLSQFQCDLPQPSSSLEIAKATNLKAVEQKSAKMDDVVSDLINRTSTMAEVCIMMFERLRGTAEFFRNLLSEFGVEDEVMLQKIDDCRLDLDKSLGQAKSILDEAKNAGKTFRDFLEGSQKALSDKVAELETALNCEKMGKENLTKQLVEMSNQLKEEATNGASLAKKVLDLEAQLVEEKSRAVPDKENMVAGIREEFKKICDTMSTASKRCSSSAALKRSEGVNFNGGGSSDN